MSSVELTLIDDAINSLYNLYALDVGGASGHLVSR